MGVILMLLLASIIVAAFFLFGFIWSVKKGQFDDQKSPPLRILFDDKPTAKRSSHSSSNQLTTTKD